MEHYQQRVVDEKAALDEKLNALLVFLDGDIFEGLSQVDQALLTVQAKLMASYSTVLASRISLF